MQMFVFWLKNKSLKFIPKDVIGITSWLVQVMAWHRAGQKPLPEPMLTKIAGAIWRPYATMR